MSKEKSSNFTARELAIAVRCQLLVGSTSLTEYQCPCRGPSQCGLSVEHRTKLENHFLVVSAIARRKLQHRTEQMKSTIVLIQQYQNNLDLLAIAEEHGSNAERDFADKEMNRLAELLVIESPVVASYSIESHDLGRLVAGRLVRLDGDAVFIREDNGTDAACAVSKLELAGCLV